MRLNVTDSRQLSLRHVTRK